MLRAMLRDLRAHRGRVAMALVAIALGTAAVVGSWTMSGSIATNLVGGAARSDAGVVVRGDGKPLTTDDLDRLRGVEGVAGAAGVPAGSAGLIGRDGKLVPGPVQRAGTGWDDTGRFSLLAGRAPATGGEVAVAREQAESAGLRIGDRVRVLLSGKSETSAVVGVFDYRTLGPRSSESPDSETTPVLAYDRTTATRLFGDRLDRVELVGASPEAIAESVRALDPGRYRAVTGAELSDAAVREAASDVWSLRLTLMPFAGVALLVGMFVIANTFSMLVAQRTRQVALLRAIGARRRQVLRSGVAEAAVLGLVGATAGAVLGTALAPLLILVLRPGEDLAFEVSPLGILLGYLAGVVVTVLAAHGSARRAAAVPPMAALRADPVVPTAQLRVRTGLGLIAFGCGGIAVLATADPSSDTFPRLVALGGAAVGVLGVVLVAPALSGAVLRPLRGIADRFGGPALRLAVRGAVRDPRRTAGTATALMIGLTLVCAFATVSATFATLIGSTFRVNVAPTTTVLRAAAGSSLQPTADTTLAAADVADAARLPGVRTVLAEHKALAEVRYEGGSTRRVVSAVDPAHLREVLPLRMTGGAADLRGGVLVSRNQADMLGLTTGEEFSLAMGPRWELRTRVAGIYEATELQASIFFDAALAPPGMRERVAAAYATGPDPEAARGALEAHFRDRPDVEVLDREALVADGVAKQDAGFLVMFAMFGLAIVIAASGVVNTLALSVVERTREIGMLRAVGAGRAVVRRSVLLESLVITAFGGVLGIASGLGVGAVMQHVMLGQPLWPFTVPWTPIALSLAGMVAVGVLAAVWPARRAAGTSVLAAIAIE
ncbi:ABC transporter permease [Saccharopolyspora erythraea]|uniref:ABC transporter permease n=1 Tax=Saccharopolyspora erythraea TaxID=1836 RepID=UPI001BAAB58F|nr:ABC transporter permease [Saccharopolyspora erythraea]QUH03111.1 ABC transporter permease [Saccharopolyspora erythraea]